MATDTTTIRVSRATHDALAAHARERGVSLAGLLAEIAEERSLDVMWQSEHEASAIDERNDEARTESLEWDATSGDGVD